MFLLHFKTEKQRGVRGNNISAIWCYGVVSLRRRKKGRIKPPKIYTRIFARISNKENC